MSSSILIVDDEKNTRDGLRTALDSDFDVYVAADANGAVKTMETMPIDVLLTDLRLGGDDGMTLIGRALELPKPPICIMMTAYGSVDSAVEAMKKGAYDFVTKPVNIDRLEMLVRRALKDRATRQENKVLRERVEKQLTIEGMIGRSPAMIEVFDTIKQVAPSKATVLIQGESGTGKELAAHAIHHLSPRAKEKFLAVHCAALAPDAMAAVLDYDWPGNVRELRTAIEHGVVMSTADRIALRDLPASVRDRRDAPSSPTAPGGLNLQETETALILRALEDCRGNRTDAARMLGISRRTLHRRLKELNISKRSNLS